MLTKPESVFLSVLPIGRDNAITAREISGLMQQRLGYAPSERMVRQIASDLRKRVKEHGVIIGSSPHRPYGFYRPANQAEAEECREELARRLREVRRTVAAFDRAVKRERVAAALQQAGLPGIELRA